MKKLALFALLIFTFSIVGYSGEMPIGGFIGDIPISGGGK